MYAMLPFPENDRNRYRTGLMKLDVALNGGLEPGEILEIYGKSSTGKSLMVQTILTELCHRRKDGTAALYIDAKNDLVPSRVFHMFGESHASMRKVRLVKQPKAKDILKILKYFDQEIALGQTQFCKQLRVIIIDSLPAILYGIRTEDNESWRIEVEKFLIQLKKMASERGLIVIVVNHAVSNFNTREKLLNPVKPALGKQCLPFPHFRLLLSRVNTAAAGSTFRATLEKGSRVVPNQYFDYNIGELGIVTS